MFHPHHHPPLTQSLVSQNARKQTLKAATIDRYQNPGCLTSKNREEMTMKGHREIGEMMELLYILTIVVVMWLCPFSKPIKQ